MERVLAIDRQRKDGSNSFHWEFENPKRRVGSGRTRSAGDERRESWLRGNPMTRTFQCGRRETVRRVRPPRRLLPIHDATVRVSNERAAGLRRFHRQAHIFVTNSVN